MTGGLVATYHVLAGAADVDALALDIAVEQTVEVTRPLWDDPFLVEHVVGRVLGVAELAPGRFEVRIGYTADVLSSELPQVFSALYGNVSLKRGIRLAAVEPSPELVAALGGGPRHGVAGIRALAGEPSRPLLMSALKPLGRPVARLADWAYRLARGGIDFLKDDHGIADQALCPFRERVEACAAAVARANAETGGRTRYFPCVTGPADRVLDRARFARDAGAGGLLIAPMVAGLDFVRACAAATGLPVLAHPAMAGALCGSPDHGIAREVLLGTLFRLAGADFSVFPSSGGRFPITDADLAAIDRELKRDLAGARPAFPVPAGGLTLPRVPGLRALFGDDVVFLVGSALYERSPDLEANAAHFRSLVGRGPVAA
jgi:ribulose-bisphosphate carboxylase large chain